MGEKLNCKEGREISGFADVEMPELPFSRLLAESILEYCQLSCCDGCCALSDFDGARGAIASILAGKISARSNEVE